ncbi:hypothetical protein IWX90DRAFT_483904 [Phyllosticta citrichinensis]|uniref:RING-type domain-containing protein n=1 Tax=Phyllosticta citrichinensis TaxID=1130410 RepID=A0ABR1Y3Y6_9PEZI
MPPHRESPQEPNALEVIFTCDICQASIADLYRNDDAATDFQDGRSEGSDRRVTSLWLTSCMHLTCANHLEGGGAPFHPQGEHPRAPCPFCVTTDKDDRPKKLYAVRGWDKGTYDAAIPDVLFQAPPMQLDGQDMRMEALNFQYQSLLRYGAAARARYHDTEEARRKSAAAAKQSQTQHDAFVAENDDLKARVASLEKDAATAAKLSAKMPQITHYLSLWPKAMDEIESLRRQLQQLGYAVPRHDYSMKAVQTAKSNAVAAPAELQDFPSSESSNKKRKRSPAPNGAMPPPKGLRGGDHPELPSRNTFKEHSERADPRSVPTRHQPRGKSYDENGTWKRHDREAGEANLLAANAGRQRALDEEYTMSGANPQRSPQVTHMQANLATQAPRRHHRSDETTHRPARSHVPETPRIAARKHSLHTGGPSYAYQNGVSERQLPEENPRPSRYYEEVNSDTQLAGQSRIGGDQDFGQAKEKLRHGSYSNRRPLDVREPLPGYTTPMPGRMRAPGSVRLPKSGSSPFFKRSHHETSSAMPGLSANARIGSVSKNMQNLRMTPAQQGWDKPRTLNGLSFIQDPRGTSNEPLLQYRQSDARNAGFENYSTQAGAVRRTEDGFFKRPERPQQRLSSSYFQNAPAPAPTPSTQPSSSLQHASRSQLQPPPSSSRDPRTVPQPPPGFADHEALRIIQGPSSWQAAAATPSFYQHQIFERGGAERGAGQAPPPLMQSRGLFSSAGGRRSVRR